MFGECVFDALGELANGVIGTIGNHYSNIENTDPGSVIWGNSPQATNQGVQTAIGFGKLGAGLAFAMAVPELDAFVAGKCAFAAGRAASVANNVKRFTKDQQALVELADEAKKRGNLDMESAWILYDLAEEYKLEGSMPPHYHEKRNYKEWHVRIGPKNHITIKK